MDPSYRLAIATCPHQTLIQTMSGIPSLLVSFACIGAWTQALRKQPPALNYGDWVIDSGAFSAWNSGEPIRLKDYIPAVRDMLHWPKPPVEIFSLDVIGDWKASLRNTELMWKAGIPAIPCYHHGEPLDVLKGLARDYPKIALGGVAKRTDREWRVNWALECVSSVWPKKVHGFGMGDPPMILRVPFHTVDSTTWSMAQQFGRWVRFGGGAALSVRNPVRRPFGLKAEVEYYLELERKMRARWPNEMKELDAAA